MIVCSCNVLNDKQVEACVQLRGGCCLVRDVYADLGCKPQCGQCARGIAQVISRVVEENRALEPLTATCGGLELAAE